MLTISSDAKSRRIDNTPRLGIGYAEGLSSIVGHSRGHCGIPSNPIGIEEIESNSQGNGRD